MQCPGCGSETPETAKFCEECGTPFVQSCPSCGQQARPTAKFCSECGTALKTEGKPAPAKSRKRRGAPSARKAPRPAPQPVRARVQPASPEAERRQLTVMFCDLVGSTALSTQLDPEELREVIRAYRETCATVIHRFDGYLAKYIGDGLLVYFGYPVAHEDDAPRAVRAGLGIVGAMQELPLQNTRSQHPLQVRIGIHTGLVVAGEMGVGDRPEPLAIVGETPNIAARLQEQAQPNSVVISATTARLVTGLFECQDLGPQMLKGLSTPLAVYRVVGEGTARNRFEVAVQCGLTPLVGRAQEVGLLHDRWARAKKGDGQVVLLSGEAGIGKSRLVQALKEQVGAEGATRMEFRCSPYHQHSAFHPLIEHLQRVLQFQREDMPQAKLAKLEQTLAHYRFPQADTVPLVAALLSLPHPAGCPALTLSPQRQKQKTQEALVAWLLEEAERAPVYCPWEDVHWADPSTVEFLRLCLDQAPTARILVVLTFRPEFQPPWGSLSYMSQLTLSRLGRKHVETMVEKVTGGKALPAEVVQQIVSKTDGVPLFVEELTKIVVESGLVREANGRYELTEPLPPLAIPATLHDSLMARLDRLAPVRELAQLGATLGREFSYEVLRAVSPLDEATLQQGLTRLVDAELVYQRGLPPQARYRFKHTLVQETAYQSLLKSKRQQYHSQIAQVLEARFPETVRTQPELLAHHYTEAGLIAQAIPSWQQAGQGAVQRSANIEAISHLTKGLELLKTLPETPERTQRELTLQILLGAPLTATKGYAAPEVEQVYARARELCRHVDEAPQLFPVLLGLWRFYLVRGELPTARELGQQLLTLAQTTQDAGLLLGAHNALGVTLFYSGELVPALAHLEQGLAVYDPDKHSPTRSPAFRAGQDPGVACQVHAAWALWLLGYPDQALTRIGNAHSLAQELSHPFSRAYALHFAAGLHHCRRESHASQEQAAASLTLASEYGFALFLTLGAIHRGWGLIEQGQSEAGMTQMRQGLAAYRATGAELRQTAFLPMLAEACQATGQCEEGLSMIAEALAVGSKTGERFYEAELYRLKGELTLKQFGVRGSEFGVPNTQHPTPSTQAEAEACFQQASEIARRQQAKSLELRAGMSLSRLWQQQGKKEEAHRRLAEIYGWFTEGFDTKDLQEARALLDTLS